MEKRVGVRGTSIQCTSVQESVVKGKRVDKKRSEECGEKVRTFNFASTNTEDRLAPLKDRIALSVSDWLKSLYYADFIFTDSFHGCVFSIIFNKPFVLYVNNQRGRARFDSLLTLFVLHDRVICKSDDLVSINLCKKIDWTHINEKRQSMAVDSINFLKNSLL